VPIQVTHGVKAATLVQFSDNVSKHRMEPAVLILTGGIAPDDERDIFRAIVTARAVAAE
jgi:hypothetical protein